jgi:transposase
MSYIKKHKRDGKVYLSEVESKRVNGKVITKHIRYIGKEVDGETIISTSISDIELERVKVYGPLILLNHIAQEIGLSDLLGEFGNEILSMVFAHCINYKSINQMPDWFKRTDLNMLLDLDDLTEHRLLMALDSLTKNDPLILQKKIFEVVKNKYNISDKGIVYDVTNTYFYGKKCELSRQGKDKDGVKGRPLIQIGLVVTQKEGIPVFHKIYHGNIHDSKIFSDMITLFREYGIINGVIVFDRGISSKQNQLSISKLKWKVLCGLPIGIELKKILHDTISNKNFLNIKNRVKLNKTVFYVEIIPYSIAGIKGKLAFCFNERKSRILKESRYDEIVEAKKLLLEGKNIKDGLEKFITKDGKLIMGNIKAAEELDGYSAIFTTEKLSKENIVKMYFDKDLIEKAFQNMKGVINLRPIKHWLFNRVISHVFICYLSYLLLSILKIKLEKIEIKPLQALKEIDTLYKVYLKDKKKNFKFEKIVSLTKIQEKIIKAVGAKLLTKS